jgi:hypothetical protein
VNGPWSSSGAGRYGPLPAGVYTGTMSAADVYPDYKSEVGLWSTQDMAIPANAEAWAEARARADNLGAAPQQLIGSPAGWLALAVLIVLVATWVVRE